MTSRWLYRLANTSPLVQGLAIFCALLVLAGVFVGDYELFGAGSGRHKPILSDALANPSPDIPVPTSTAATTTAVQIPTTSTVATANANIMLAYSSPSTRSSVTAHLTQHNLIGQVNAFLVVGTAPGGWVQALLPVRPNGTTGWFPPDEVQVGQVSDFLLANLSSFTLEHYVDGKLVATFPVGVGLPATPTPTGMFYVYANQAHPGPPYDPVILALSAFSPTLLNWPLGGIIGIHGWSDTSVEGRPVSNGCLRMRPRDATRLANLPLGTPVEIIA
jgi:hypothetical protein